MEILSSILPQYLNGVVILLMGEISLNVTLSRYLHFFALIHLPNLLPFFRHHNMTHRLGILHGTYHLIVLQKIVNIFL